MNKLRCLLSVEFGFPHPIRLVFIPTIKLTYMTVRLGE